MVVIAHAFTSIFGEIRVAQLFLDLCVVLWCVFTLWVPCCDVGHKFHIKTIIGSSLPPAICKAACLVFFIYAWLRIMMPDTFCVVFLFCFVRLVYLMLSVSLGCTFVVLSLRYSLTFTNIYDIYIYFIIINYFVIGGWSFFFSCMGCLGWSWSSADSFVFLNVTAVSLQKQYIFNYM